MNEFTRRQIELELEMATLSGCRAQLRDLWLENSSPELLAAMQSILSRLKIAELALDSVIEARNIAESASSRTAVPIINLRLRL